jgi:hypothetical protein
MDMKPVKEREGQSREMSISDDPNCPSSLLLAQWYKACCNFNGILNHTVLVSL